MKSFSVFLVVMLGAGFFMVSCRRTAPESREANNSKQSAVEHRNDKKSTGVDRAIDYTRRTTEWEIGIAQRVLSKSDKKSKDNSDEKNNKEKKERKKDS